MKNALRTMPAGEPANANAEPEPIPDPVEHERVVKVIALGMFTGGLNAYQQLLMGGQPNPPIQITQSSTEIMTADEVAEFLGVDRNTVYEYAGRGAIPHQRLGKRILFRRGAILSWLEGCKATSTRKG